MVGVQARQKDATNGQMRLGEEMASSLQRLIAPFFLRRTKAQMAKEAKNEGNSAHV